ncbi:MAG: hypothetical protein ACK5JR_02215 [Tropicimonas sp.]|uniref:hypothetical protein n=1 Tax=Tropicimonas sp. TaxID=2067044 RepID=UPI003A84A1C7
MRLLRNLAIVLSGAAALAGLQATTPYFDDAFSPFVTRARSAELAHGRLFDARFTEWRLAGHVGVTINGAPTLRGTDGVFLIAGIELSDVRQTLPISAVWLGSSGRRYAASARFQGSDFALETRNFNPHVPNAARILFELPRDEVVGGQLVLAVRGSSILDSELHLAPPPGKLVQQAFYEVGG